MHFTHRRAHANRSASKAVPLRNRVTTPGSTRAPLTLVGVQPYGGPLRSVEGARPEERESAAARQLEVSWGRRREALVISLSGTLDRRTRPLLDTELDAQAVGAMALVVDLTELVFIDASGLDTLARIHSRATERGDRLSFRHGQHVAQRPLGLIRAAQVRSAWAPRRAPHSAEDSYFALAMACADVDHPGLGDRPRAA